jgi:hypothetical protein
LSNKKLNSKYCKLYLPLFARACFLLKSLCENRRSIFKSRGP